MQRQDDLDNWPKSHCHANKIITSLEASMRTRMSITFLLASFIYCGILQAGDLPIKWRTYSNHQLGVKLNIPESWNVMETPNWPQVSITTPRRKMATASSS